MPSNGEQQPPDRVGEEPSGRPVQGPSRPSEQRGGRPAGPPEYTLYRSRRGLLSRLRTPDVSSLRERARRSYRRLGRGGPKAEDQAPPAPKPIAKRALKWLA